MGSRAVLLSRQLQVSAACHLGRFLQGSLLRWPFRVVLGPGAQGAPET